nr:hypothetical protein [Tanacetum cinerariifolium]
NIDYAFLIWEDFLYQVEHKNQKNCNEMYYPRFTKVIIHHFMSKDLSIPRRNKNTQQYGAVLPIELTNEEIKNTKAYKEYYACATGEAAPKPKASAKRKRSGSDTSITPPTAITTLTTTGAHGGSSIDEGTGSKPGVPDVPSDDSEEDISWNSSDDEETDTQEQDRHDDEETREEESFDPIPRTPEDSEDDGNGEKDQGLRISDEERIYEEEKADELYHDSSSVSSQFVTSMLNPTSDVGMESIFATASSSVAPLPIPTPTMTPSIIITITTASHPPIPPTPIPSEVLQNLPTFDSVFHFDERLKSLEANFSKYRQIISFAEVVSNIPDENIKRIIKEQVKSQVKEQVSRILPRIEKSVNAQLEAEVLTRSSHSSRTSYAVVADLSKIELKKILIEKMEGNKSIQRSDKQRNLYKALVDAYEADKTILDSYGETTILKRRREDDDDQDGPSAGSDRRSKRRREGGEPESASAPLVPTTRSTGRSTTGSKSRQASASESAFTEEPNKTLPAAQGSTQLWISNLAKQADSRSSFNELLDTPLDFSNFIINRVGVDTLTPELLARPTYELMRGSCNSLTELEYHLEEVYKAMTDQLDWVNPEGASSKKYTTSATKTKAAEYRHIKWIEDLVPRTMWIQEPINYEKHALWEVSHWGRKRQQFYGFTVNREPALDISIRRDDDKIYKFKEGNFKRLRLQDIKDMLLLLVQGKLSNLIVKECFAFNVSLRMFTRSIVIQQRVEDLQLGVESYQKRLNLKKPNTYWSDLKRREAYTAYSNTRGLIYQNKDKKNRLMRIDELHKFSDETLNDVCNALDDRLKEIRMQYLPQTI